MLWCISYILDVFRTISLQHDTRCRTSQIGAINSKVRATKACRIFYNDCTRSTPFDPKLIILVHFVPFGRVWTIFFLLKLISKWAKLVQLMQDFVPRNCVEIFRNERTQSTQLDPKLMFWCISYSLGAFGTVLLPYETRFKSVRTGAINTKVRATKS